MFRKNLLAVVAVVIVGLILGCGEDKGNPGTGGGGITGGDSTTGTNTGGGSNGGASTVKFGTLNDVRDGQTYKTVKIGDQTWMAQNLNYKAENSLCYENSEFNCEKYGGLYRWEDAVVVCPSDWHLPSAKEWQILVNYAGGDGNFAGYEAGKKLGSMSEWRFYDSRSHTDEYGFSGLPGGFREYGEFRSIGEYAKWWADSLEINPRYEWTTAHSWEMSPGSIEPSHDDTRTENRELSVRCLLDGGKTQKYVVTILGGIDDNEDERYVNSRYIPGTKISISAWYPPPNGKRFENWEVESSGVTMNNANNAATTFIMPENAVTIKARFVDIYVKSGSFIDTRDGQTYKMVTIENKTWMAQNLNYYVDETFLTKNASCCYGGDIANCEKYGRLYDWETAKLVCPSGWHLATKEDWTDLAVLLGDGLVASKKLMAHLPDWYEGMGTDDYGFSALPGGYNTSLTSGCLGGSFLGTMGFWWTSTEAEHGWGAYRWAIPENLLSLSINSYQHIYSVRCVQD